MLFVWRQEGLHFLCVLLGRIFCCPKHLLFPKGEVKHEKSEANLVRVVGGGNAGLRRAGDESGGNSIKK